MTVDEPMQRLLEYDRRRYWLVNGWSIRFRAAITQLSEVRPHGIKYSFTPHDVDGTRLLGYDNAHGVGRALPTTIGIDSGEQRSWCRMNSGARTN